MTAADQLGGRRRCSPTAATVHLRPIRPEDADGSWPCTAAAPTAPATCASSRRTRASRNGPAPVHPRRPPRPGGVRGAARRPDHRRRPLRAPRPRTADAEVAFVVEDAHQGRGIGSVLLEHLAAAAARERHQALRRRGAGRRTAGWCGSSATPATRSERQYEDGVVHLTFPIAQTEATLAVLREREQRTEARSIARLLAPRRSPSSARATTGQGVGNALLGHLREGGFTGPVVPGQPRGAARARGCPPTPSAADPRPDVDLAVLAVPADAVADVVERRRRKRARRPGGDLRRLRRDRAGAARRRSARWSRRPRASGMRVVGPNCLGIVNTDPAVRLNATLAPMLPAGGPGRVLRQSGALGVALLAEAPAPRARAVHLRLGRQPRRRRPATTCCSTGDRPGHRGRAAVPGVLRQPAQVRPAGPPLGRTKPVVAVKSGWHAAARAGGDARRGARAVGERAVRLGRRDPGRDRGRAVRRRPAAGPPAAAGRATGRGRRQLAALGGLVADACAGGGPERSPTVPAATSGRAPGPPSSAPRCGARSTTSGWTRWSRCSCRRCRGSSPTRGRLRGGAARRAGTGKPVVATFLAGLGAGRGARRTRASRRR